MKCTPNAPQTLSAPSPLVGEGWGRGVARFAPLMVISHDPHPQPLPTRGRGSKPIARHLVEQTTMSEGYSRATALTAASVVGRPASSASVTGFTGGRRR